MHDPRRTLAALALLALLAASLPAFGATRNCTAVERTEANQLLQDIQRSPAKSDALIKQHVPLGLSLSADTDNEYILTQTGYVMQHDEDLLTTLWVSYELTATDLARAGRDRVTCFRPDPRVATAETTDPGDYNEPIYDQGHMANDADLKDEPLDQINSYIMSTRRRCAWTLAFSVLRPRASPRHTQARKELANNVIERRRTH